MDGGLGGLGWRVQARPERLSSKKGEGGVIFVVGGLLRFRAGPKRGQGCGQRGVRGLRFRGGRG